MQGSQSETYFGIAKYPQYFMKMFATVNEIKSHMTPRCKLTIQGPTRENRKKLVVEVFCSLILRFVKGRFVQADII